MHYCAKASKVNDCAPDAVHTAKSVEASDRSKRASNVALSRDMPFCYRRIETDKANKVRKQENRRVSSDYEGWEGAVGLKCQLRTSRRMEDGQAN